MKRCTCSSEMFQGSRAPLDLEKRMFSGDLGILPKM